MGVGGQGAQRGLGLKRMAPSTRGLRNERGGGSAPHTATSSSWARTSPWGDQHLLILHIPLQTQVYSPPPAVGVITVTRPWGLGYRLWVPGPQAPFSLRRTAPALLAWRGPLAEPESGGSPGEGGEEGSHQAPSGPPGSRGGHPAAQNLGEAGAHVGPGAEERPPRRPGPRPARAPTTAQKLRT